jgi:hypothetical protein
MWQPVSKIQDMHMLTLIIDNDREILKPDKLIPVLFFTKIPPHILVREESFFILPLDFIRCKPADSFFERPETLMDIIFRIFDQC